MCHHFFLPQYKVTQLACLACLCYCPCLPRMWGLFLQFGAKFGGSACRLGPPSIDLWAKTVHGNITIWFPGTFVVFRSALTF